VFSLPRVAGDVFELEFDRLQQSHLCTARMAQAWAPSVISGASVKWTKSGDHGVDWHFANEVRIDGSSFKFLIPRGSSCQSNAAVMGGQLCLSSLVLY